MKKLLLFVLLFGAGLTVLLYFVNKNRRVEQSTTREHPPLPQNFTELPVPRGEGEQGTPLQGQLNGRFDQTLFVETGPDAGKPLLTTHSDFLQAVGGDQYDAKNLVVQLHNPETRAVRFHLASPNTRVHIPLAAGHVSWGTGETVRLDNVEMTMNEGAPIVPLTLAVPRLEWRLTEAHVVESFRSSDHVQINGRGLSAEGTGLDARVQEGVLELQQSGIVRLALQDGGEAVLTATGTGPIRLVRTQAPEGELLEMTTTDGARLDVRGDEPISLVARTLHLFGQRGGDAEPFRIVRAEAQEDVVAESRGDTFRARHAEFQFTQQNRFERGVLDGAVVLESSGDVFRGDQAEFSFDAAGHVVRAILNGSPSGTLQLGKYLPAKPPAGPLERELRSATARISGAGPLVTDLGGDTKIELTGPGRVEVPEMGFLLEVQGSLAGQVGKDQKSGSLAARGGVHGTYAQTEIRSEGLDLNYVLTEPGSTAVTATTSGPTTVQGQTQGGEPFELEARDGLEVRTAQERISIPIARQVVLHAGGEKGFDARADLVRDLDWQAETFTAEGNVQFSNAAGDGNAERAVAHGQEALELYGTPADPARWTLSRRPSSKGPLEAAARALEIRASQDELHARGAVVADVSAGPDRQHLESEALDLTLDPAADPARPQERNYHARARGAVHATFAGPEREGELRCETFAVDGLASLPEAGAPPKLDSAFDMTAEGGVRVDLRGKGQLHGQGQRFTYDRTRRGRLEAAPKEHVEAQGTIGAEGLPYVLTATWIEFDDDHLEGADVAAGLAPEVLGAPPPPGGAPSLLELRTRHFRADTHQILLDGDAHARGQTGGAEPWSIDAGTLRLNGNFARDQKVTREDLHLVEAMGGFSATLGERASAQGETLSGTLSRIRIEGAPAKLHLPGARLESSWIQYDADQLLLSSDKGILQPELSSSETPWSVTYESLQPFSRGESTILVLRNPLFEQGEKQLRAAWALFWVDHEEWSKRGSSAMRENAGHHELRVTVPEVEPTPGKHKATKTTASKFLELRQNPIAQVLSELYIEGNPELTIAGDRIMRATAIYLDLKEGRGWVRDADVVRDINVRNLPQRIRARADWMSVGPDLTLRADKAVLTSCDYDDPHYVIETGDLRVRFGSKKDYSITASQNSLRLGGAWAMPLPKFFFGQENGYPFIGDINLGDSARFGTSVQAALNLPLGGLGLGIGSVFGKLLDLPKIDVPEGRWKLNAGILGTRGVLLGTGLEYLVKDPDAPDPAKARTIFHFDSTIDAIPDDQQDKGFIRVDPDDRPLLRNWFRVRARWTPEEQRWWDLALSIQSDPGVQSEFFERDFVNYEQKDNFLHYRSSWDDWYLYGSVKLLLEDRTDIEELPSLGLVSGRRTIGSLGDLPLYYSSRTDVGYLRRHDGDPEFYPPFPDGLGDREVVRADTTQRLEVPIDLGLGAIRMTPFVEGRLSAWDTNIDQDGSPVRAALLAGVELGTTFWKRFSNGSIHALAPTLALHGDVGVEQNGGDPVRFDNVEDPVDGKFVDFSLRSRWWRPQSKQRFDVELTSSYGFDLPNGAKDGLQPVAALAEFLTFAGEVPLGFTHDGRYDTESGNTIYSRTFVGFEPVHDWGIELGYHLGRDAAEEVLYEAATLGMRYRASQKWELEFEQSYSLSDSRGLGNIFTLRRLGHDFVMELGVGYRAGEGSSFNLSFKPLFAWKRSGLGLIDRWLSVYH